MGSLLVLIVGYRAHLWFSSESLAASGRIEESLSAIFADPLGRIEVAVAYGIQRQR